MVKVNNNNPSNSLNNYKCNSGNHCFFNRKPFRSHPHFVVIFASSVSILKKSGGGFSIHKLTFGFSVGF